MPIIKFKEHLLNEASKNECFQRFENVLFGENRRRYDTSIRYEPNTVFENSLFPIIRKWIIGDYEYDKKNVSTKLKQAFEELAECKEHYAKDLKPKVQQVYRGTVVKGSVIEKAKWERDRDGLWYVSDNYKYKPRGKYQSWSTSKAMAGDFPEEYGPNKYHIILETTTKGTDWLFSHNFLNYLMDYNEDEIVHLDDNPIMCKMHISAYSNSTHLIVNADDN